LHSEKEGLHPDDAAEGAGGGGGAGSGRVCGEREGRDAGREGDSIRVWGSGEQKSEHVEFQLQLSVSAQRALVHKKCKKEKMQVGAGGEGEWSLVGVGGGGRRDKLLCFCV